MSKFLQAGDAFVNTNQVESFSVTDGHDEARLDLKFVSGRMHSLQGQPARDFLEHLILSGDAVVFVHPESAVAKSSEEAIKTTSDAAR